MTYQDTLDYLFTRLPMFSRIGAAAYKKDLTNTLRLCEELGNPHQKVKTIHVAGTNGKGSVSHMLAAILQTAGYKTGLYTSPHLKDFRERIKVDGAMVSEEFVIDFTRNIQPLISEIEPSFFEITVAMAFDYFNKQQVDIAVIEVGLGGRLDSTNIITPELSVITNIGYDHMNMLGETLEEIATEKAGIIKQNIPVVIGEVLPETTPVFEKIAVAKKAPLSIASHKHQVTDWKWEDHQLIVTVSDTPANDHHTYQLDLPGVYQAKNLLTVIEACHQLKQKGWRIEPGHIHSALGRVRKLNGLNGRWEVLHTSPLLVVDVAHNEDGIKQLLQQVELTEHKQLHVVMGLVKDKDPSRILQLLPKQAHYYFTKAHIPRALPEDELKKIASRHGLLGETYSTVNTAVYSASLKAGKKDMIVVCGSIFLVGELSANIARAVWGKDEVSAGMYALLGLSGYSG